MSNFDNSDIAPSDACSIEEVITIKSLHFAKHYIGEALLRTELPLEYEIKLHKAYSLITDVQSHLFVKNEKKDSVNSGKTCKRF